MKGFLKKTDAQILGGAEQCIEGAASYNPMTKQK